MPYLPVRLPVYPLPSHTPRRHSPRTCTCTYALNRESSLCKSRLCAIVEFVCHESRVGRSRVGPGVDFVGKSSSSRVELVGVDFAESRVVSVPYHQIVSTTKLTSRYGLRSRVEAQGLWPRFFIKHQPLDILRLSIH